MVSVSPSREGVARTEGLTGGPKIPRKGVYIMAKHLNPLQKEFIIHQYKGNPGITLKDFCLVQNITEPTMKRWLRQYEEGGLAGLARADAQTADIFPEGTDSSEEAMKREILRLRIENERLKKNYMVRKTEDGKTEYCRLRPKNTR